MLNNALNGELILFGGLYPRVLWVVGQVKARFFHIFDRDSPLAQHEEVDVFDHRYLGRTRQWRIICDYNHIFFHLEFEPETVLRILSTDHAYMRL